MPSLDRRITITLAVAGMYNQYGEWVPGTSSDLEIWAGRDDLSQEDIAREEGMRTDVRRRWRIRWRRDLALANVQNLSVTEGAVSFNVLGLVEDTGRDMSVRHRWMILEGLAIT